MIVRSTEFDLQVRGPSARCEITDVTDGHSSRAPFSVRIGTDREGRLPSVESAAFDVLLTTAERAPPPWIVIARTEFDTQVDMLNHKVPSLGPASAILAQVLRATESLEFEMALNVESFAYSMLQSGAQFHRWMQSRAISTKAKTDDSRLRFTREGDTLTIHLANVAQRNAFDAAMRDALVEALTSACDDPSLQSLEIRGDGPHFSAGGDLQEFGSSTDFVAAHMIRSLRAPARLLQGSRARTVAHLHGACVGAGIEFAAAADHIVAAPDTQCWLPELAMGLIPGAGGTVTIARRIGRMRLLHWALSETRIDAPTALEWGLVDAIAA